MMEHIAKDNGLLNNYIRSYFSEFRDTIGSTSILQWRDEDLKGYSYQQWNINRYYSLLYLLIILHLDYQRLSKIKDWSYFIEKYNLIEYKKCLACYNISLEKCLEIFNLQNLEVGIELVSIEDTFVIGNSSTTSKVNIGTNGCINLIN